MPSPSQRLTLLALAEEGGRLLPACLASARDVADAWVVVDLGLSEASLSAARAAGARIVSAPGVEDRVMARNSGLATIPDGWVLVLDGDEQLVVGAAPSLRRAIDEDRLDIGLMAVHDADTLEAPPLDVIAGRSRRGEPVLSPRLLRRTPDLRFTGRIDGHLSPVSRDGRRVESLDVSIVRYGDVPELALQGDGAARRLARLERACKLHPTEVGVRASLALELLRAGDDARGREEAARAWELAAADEACDPGDVVLAATLHAFQCLGKGDLDEAAATLAHAAEGGAAHPNIDLLAGALLESLAVDSESPGEQAEALAGARAAYERCLSLSGTLFEARPLPGATSWAARTRLATVDLLCGRPDEALAGFDEALRGRPSLVEARLGRLEALLDLGMAPETLQGLEPWLQGGSPDAWTLAAAAAAALGSTDDAALFAERARDASATRPWAGPHRRLRLEAVTPPPA